MAPRHRVEGRDREGRCEICQELQIVAILTNAARPRNNCGGDAGQIPLALILKHCIPEIPTCPESGDSKSSAHDLPS